jgi:hypothetical protein
MDPTSRIRRHQARLLQQQIESARMRAHAPVAKMLRSSADRDFVVQCAYDPVAKWREGRLCSPDFIDAWAYLLAHPNRAADMLESESPVAYRLRQNSPFAAFLKAPLLKRKLSRLDSGES